MYANPLVHTQKHGKLGKEKFRKVKGHYNSFAANHFLITTHRSRPESARPS